MSAVATSAPYLDSPVTVDEELQDLYNQVLAGFVDDPHSGPSTSYNRSSSTLGNDIDSFVSVYTNSEETTQANDSFSNRMPTTARRTTSKGSQGRQPRPLPSIPGVSASPTSSISSVPGAPEPRPYHEQPRKHLISQASFSNIPSPDSSLKGFLNGRSVSKPSVNEYSPNPSDPRYLHNHLPEHLRASISSTTVNAPASAFEPHDSDSIGRWRGPSRPPYSRPSGSLLATTPGHVDMPMPEPYIGDHPDVYSSPSHPNSSNAYTDVTPPPVLPPKPAGLLKQIHASDLNLHHNASIDYSTSISSSLYSVSATVDRNSSAASAATSGAVSLAASSSTSTAVDRYPSYTQRGFDPQPSTILDEKRALNFPDTEEAEEAECSREVHLGLHEDYIDEGDADCYVDDYESDEDDSRFVDFSLLSHIAMRLRDKVPRDTHVKGSIPYPRAFTGKDIVSTIQSQIQRELLMNHGISTSDRRAALQVARSLQSQLFFYEVEWGGRVLTDGVEDVYMFLDDQETSSDLRTEREELPTGVITFLTKCYTPSCMEGSPCYAYSCPRRKESLPLASPPITETPVEHTTVELPPEILASLPESEVRRQTIIRKVVTMEQQYLHDLDFIESIFIRPLRSAEPPIIKLSELEEFIDEVFGNILDLRECNRRLLEVLFVRQREQGEIVSRVGDIFLEAAAEFRLVYPTYIGHLPMGEKAMKDEMEVNAEFRLFLEQCSRHADNVHKLDLKRYLNRPSEQLQKYTVLFEAIQNETAKENPDADFLTEAIQAMKNLQSIAQLRIFQTAMGKGPTGKYEWHSLVPDDVRATIPKDTIKRQAIIFELIKGEMAYVKDLENIEYMYVRPLRAMDPPIIPRDRLDSFIQDVFHNFGELHVHHRRLCERIHEIQREEHPIVRSVTAAMYDAVLNFRDAYLDYIPNYPIAAYRIDDEMANNSQFKDFVEQCVRHPDAHRLDMKSFINRPIPRLLRYELLLKNILEVTPEGYEDIDTIPAVLDVIKGLGKESEPGVVSAKQKVELWRYNSNLSFKAGEVIDMDLLNENRSLIHTGKLLRQPETGFEWSGWTELFVLLFDNYLVMTKPKDKDGVTKYQVYRRPIPLDLLTLTTFNDPPTQRGGGLIPFRGKSVGGSGVGSGYNENPTQVGTPMAIPEASESRGVYPCNIHHNGRLGGLYTLYAESAQLRGEWKAKLEEAIGLRKVVQESNKVFEVETLSADTFLAPSAMVNSSNPSWNNDNSFTGKVTCSVPFNTADGRGLVAIGCAEGVWIGFRHDSKSMRRVLHLKMVTQCTMLEEFGIFLVLADKSLFAYHIEALVPSSPHASNATQTPQKLSGNKDVHFFSVGNLGGRTLVIYMKKKGLESVFRVLEPVVGKINEKVKAPASIGSRFGLRSQRSEWFRIYRDFFLPSESFDLIFLKAKIVILCAKGFEIMDLSDFKSVTIPQREDPKLEKLAKRCESCQPMGMFRSNKDEFLLCYDEFGLYVDKHGDPSRRIGTVEWEGTAERVAWHAPYILLFDSRFIEIRHVESGRLVQIIPGNDMRCIWDGRGATSSSVTPNLDGNWDESVSQEPRVHGVMNIESAHPGRRGVVTHHVFELIPTVPLYLPGSLSSPGHASYFNQSNSPPHSPRLNPALSYR